MNTEPKLWAALIRARQAIQPIGKTATNPHFRNSYAPLGEVLAAVLPALHAEGLALTAAVGTVGGEGPALGVRIVHAETGEMMESAVPLVGGTDMQKLGGAMTYAMRYAIGMLLALELEDDDDGQRASQPGQRQQQANTIQHGPQGRPPQAPNPAQGAQGRAPVPQNARPAPSAPKGKGRPAGHTYYECPSCHQEAVRVNPQEGAEPHAYCWKKANGCGAKYTDSLWAVVSVPGPSNLDPPPPMARHEAPADVESLTDESNLPF